MSAKKQVGPVPFPPDWSDVYAVASKAFREPPRFLRPFPLPHGGPARFALDRLANVVSPP